jgi:hypothetical protein
MAYSSTARICVIYRGSYTVYTRQPLLMRLPATTPIRSSDTSSFYSLATSFFWQSQILSQTFMFLSHSSSWTPLLISP